MLDLSLFSKLKTNHDQLDSTPNGKNTLSVSSMDVNCTSNPIIPGSVNKEFITS